MTRICMIKERDQTGETERGHGMERGNVREIDRWRGEQSVINICDTSSIHHHLKSVVNRLLNILGINDH